MNKLKLYRVDVNYIKYLYSFDNKVQYNKEQKDEYTRKRPYLGVVLQVNEFEYFVPLEHPREAHQKMKDNIYILKIHNGKYCILGFNNMIPIKREELIEFNINNENKKYRQILISQYHFCNKHIKEIQERALKTYEKSTKNNFFKKICCDFKTLEEKSKDYCKSKCE